MVSSPVDTSSGDASRKGTGCTDSMLKKRDTPPPTAAPSHVSKKPLCPGLSR
eukprot:CAMPEP_0114115274 /NCGR_PEP_ID=MMETSP0043_2-20121206/3883_1 /TAXON_ID=464988 /ORGANISM="Hemiselmis andersenii, Strain CCMP644" /LENGTH=51 /DNA_ID=CAMNT_0001207529 /DNA_START=576 /DNA_END=731 /DNA_ORIENTATION=-